MAPLPYKSPTLTGTDSSGASLQPGTFDGQWIVLYFYPKDMTSGCTLQAQGFQENLENFKKLGALMYLSLLNIAKVDVGSSSMIR